MKQTFQVGIEVLLDQHKDWLAGKRVGLVSHPAAVDARGVMTAARLWQDPGVDLVSLFGPEHGFFGKAGAGELCATTRHPKWGIPIHSLYGRAKKPSRSALRGVDTLVFDIQDLGIRCYTYVSTLRLVLEAAAAAGQEVIVADRPIPLPRTVDGPVTEKKFRSFVSLVDTPMVYGMTPGETALWLKATLGLKMKLRIASMNGYGRTARRNFTAAKWVPPSPAIKSWESALCYPATVCFEALEAVDHGRCTNRPFQVIGSPWLDSRALVKDLTALRLPGVRFYPTQYMAGKGRKRRLKGVHVEVTRSHQFRPILTAISLIHVLQESYGKKRLWAPRKSRPDFFDKLMGTYRVREALLADESPVDIARSWDANSRSFLRAREKCLLYSTNPGLVQ